MDVLPSLSLALDRALQLQIDETRKVVLRPLIEYIQQKVNAKAEINLNFICTHNSRRSQFSQIWAKVAAQSYGVTANSYSGGVEVTEFNPRAIASMRRLGFDIHKNGFSNPHYSVGITKDLSLNCFSKTFDDIHNPTDNFAAVMTCSHADENCPFIPGAEARIPVRYEDPKAFDDTEVEAQKYDERSLQIASEMFYTFSQINKN
ncbi:MAG: protein-tyrosine-phosphatase [Bacteroidota bacterium]